MIKKTIPFLIIAATAAFIYAWNVPTQADGTNPQAGSVDDPIITKSYLEQRLQSITGGGSEGTGASASIDVDQIKSIVTEELKSRQIGSGTQDGKTSNPSDSSTLTVVQLKPEQTMFAGAGAEVIVRTGKVTLISSDGNGVPDVTAGDDLAPNTVVDNNHLLVFPRDGRGLKPDPESETDIYIMVKGSYLLVESGNES